MAALCFAVAVGTLTAGAETLKLPLGVSRASALRMYSEQVDSQENITRLVNGEMTSFEITSRTVTTSLATFRVRVRLTDGTTVYGVMTVRKFGGKWYFDSIKRSTHYRATGKVITTPDVGVLNTMLEQQSANQDVIGKLCNGTYNRVSIGVPDEGFNSKVLPVTFSGVKSSQKGEVTAIKRTVRGENLWFIVSFATVK